MSSNRKADVAIVGAGILGLAHAYFAAKRGRSVVVFERTPKAQGASVRNFGMIWPIGQRAGVVYETATRSRQIWNEILDKAALPYRPTGSLHVVYHQDEADVAREFVERAPSLGYTCTWLSTAEVLEKSAAVNPKGLLGGIWSPTELTVDPRQILAKLPAFLAEKFGVQFRFGTAVGSIHLPRIEAGAETWEATQAVVCGGDDFETLLQNYSQSAASIDANSDDANRAAEKWMGAGPGARRGPHAALLSRIRNVHGDVAEIQGTRRARNGRLRSLRDSHSRLGRPRTAR